ncbi:zf-HC2 domain-containing protein [Krasilnikoviella flava]|uniref:Putative zinc-finger n=1 Tax=Krasilnikoviella flava TaxID=526729 RepID=A0A1T5K319_9MICO|nr:zf-HC2 domain-containing protein [Krasilnikoviella flava]SKC58167.1 Putative zinc-finger [Krasilnikoviella flava]
MTAIHDGDAPARRGAVDDAIRRMRAAATADGRDDGPGAAGTVDPAVLRTVLATLPHDDQRLLWDRHVVGRELAAIATELGMHARAVLRRLRQAEERLAAAFAAAHARACPPGCLDTRQSLHSYVRHRLSPPRRTVLEAHLFGCQGCMRAFIDVREAGWAVRDAGPLLLAGAAAGVAAGGAVPVVVGALGAGTTGAGALVWSGPVGAALVTAGEWVRAIVLRLGQLGKGGLIGAGTVAGIAVAAVAVAMSGGGTGGPVAAPPAPAPTSSAVAPAPAPSDAASPDAPPEPEPSATTAPQPTPSADAPSTPSTGGHATPSTPTPGPTTTPGTTPPSSPQPSAPATGPGTSPEPSASPGPTEPSTSPSASPSPTTAPSPPASPSPKPTPPSPTPTTTPEPTPTPTEEPDPDPVRTTVTAQTSGLRGIYSVTVADADATIVKVTEDRRWLQTKECSDGWHVASWRNRVGTVTITVEAPPGVEPGVTLARTGNWPGWLHTC